MVEAVFPAHSVTCAAPFFITKEIGVSEVHAPRPLAEIPAYSSHIPYLSGANLAGCLRQNAEAFADNIRCSQLVKRNGCADSQPQLIIMVNPLHFSDMFDVNENLRGSKLGTLESIFHETQQIRPTGDHPGLITPFFQPEDSLLDTFCIRMFKSW
jgi:hypothetical protein